VQHQRAALALCCAIGVYRLRSAPALRRVGDHQPGAPAPEVVLARPLPGCH